MGLDNDVVNLAKAIRQHESGNRAVLPGEGSAVGGKSRYQYTHETWRSVAGKYLGDANTALNLQNENKATYLRIKDWKDKGFNPAQIASMWNAGEGRPDAYKQNWRGTNKYGVKYDTPAYVNRVYQTYKKLRGSNVALAAEETPTETKPKEGIFARAGKFIVKDIFGGGQEKETNIGGDLLRSTFGSRGLAGVAQMPGKVLSLPAQAKTSQMLSESAGSTAEQATQLLQRARTEKDALKKGKMIKMAKELFAESQKTLQFRDEEINKDILSPKETLSTSINAALTAPMITSGGVVGGAPVASKIGGGGGMATKLASSLYGE